MELNPNFSEFIASLNAKSVRYLVVGGFAVNLHGYPRYTKDIDFWIWLDGENIQKLLAAIDDFGFGSLGLQKSDFMTPENIVQLGYEPNRIDILVEIDGSDFEKCYENKSQVELGGVKIDFIGVQDLIVAKRRAGRLQDRADAQQLEKILKKMAASKGKSKK